MFIPPQTHKVSVSSDVSYTQLISKSLELHLEDSDSFLYLDNVRVFPPYMTFKDAFEGKSYYQKLTIQNCGKTAAFIRIGPANSSSFHIKSLIRGRHLPPGLVITRYISYTYMRATSVPLSWIPISINDTRLDYKLEVLLSCVSITAFPHLLDFGTIDAGCSAAVRMFSLRNEGSKGTRFAIDLGNNEIDLIVEPYKGIIQPHDVVNFRVECLGIREGEFHREFWVKCETPKKIDVQVNVISQKLQSFHPETTSEFTFINFGRVYFGSSFTKTSVVRNISGSPAIFCVLGDLNKKAMDFKEAGTIDPLYKDFCISPQEGCMLPNQGEIFQFTYRPIFNNTYVVENLHEKLSSCNIRICRMACVNINDIHYEEAKKEKDLRPQVEDSMSLQSEVFAFEDFDERASSEFPGKMAAYKITTVSLPTYVRVILYGEAVEPHVSLRPDAFHLQDVEANLEITRELLISNDLWDLPVIFEYKKICYVKVEPSRKYLNPLEQFEVSVRIVTAKLGKISTMIGFNLLCYNKPRDSDECVCIGYVEIPLTLNVVPGPIKLKQKFNSGITPEYIKEVGYNVDDVRFNSSITPPRATLLTKQRMTLFKYDDALVAFPNDRPKSLRPWKSVAFQCRTICGGFPRVIDNSRDLQYQLSESRNSLKLRNYSYYQKYTKEEGARLRKLHPLPFKASDYDMSNKLLLFDYLIKTKCKKLEFPTPAEDHGSIPLTPLQLENIQVHPPTVSLGKVATYTKSTANITVTNKNNFKINLFVRGRKPVILTPGGSHNTVKKNGSLVVPVVYEAPSSYGRSIVTVDFIINGTHSFMVSITADVFPKIAKCLETEVTIYPNTECHKYIKVFNMLNVPVDFSWNIPESCFTFFPMKAMIPPRSSINCMIEYAPNNNVPSSIGATLNSECGFQQNVNIVAEVTEPRGDFKVKEVDFKDTPLNIMTEKKIILSNVDAMSITYVVMNPEPLEGISVNPVTGVTEGFAEQIFMIQVKISACIKFKCTVQVELQNCKIIEFVIKGDIIYPNIVFKPSSIRLSRIVADSITRERFLIYNKSNSRVSVEFDMENYSEYYVMQKNNTNHESTLISTIELEAKECQQLYLVFRPLGAACYSFSLPCIFNGIIGPVNNLIPATKKPAHFTEEALKVYANVEDVKPIQLPKKISVLKVESSVGSDMLRFSKLNLKFKYFPDESYLSETTIDLKIWNASKDNCRFCLRTDELLPPFYLTYYNGNELEMFEAAMVCTLGPEEWVTLKASFRPCIPGDFNIRLPIYVKNYLDCHVFNYIYVNGLYPEPIISVKDSNVHFDPVVLDCESEYTLNLNISYHNSDCKLFASCNIDGVSVEISQEPVYMETTYFKKTSVVMKFSSRTPKSFNSTITFFCSCQSEFEIAVFGCADNSITTTYAFSKSYVQWLLRNYERGRCSKGQAPSSIIGEISITDASNIESQISSKSCNESTTEGTTTIANTVTDFDFTSNFNESTFPYFPEVNNESSYAKYLQSVLTVVEGWLFTQGFYCKMYLKIPEGIAFTPEATVEEKKPKSKNKKEKNEKNEKSKKKEKKDKKGKKGKKDAKEKKSMGEKKEEKDCNLCSVPYYIELLKTLVGPKICEYIPIKDIPNDNLNRVNYLYMVYSKAKDFLINNGAFLPHIFPEHLLQYNDYVFFVEKVSKLRSDFEERSMCKLLDNYTFFLLSKQSWLDMLLQTYKVLVLGRIKPPRMKEDEESEEQSFFKTANKQSYASITKNNKQVSRQSTGGQQKEMRKTSKMSNIDDAPFWYELNEVIRTKNSYIYSISENILLFWLEYHFNRSKNKIVEVNRFNYENNELEERTIKYFDCDLSDGLVLIAVTITYCPYLLQYLTDIYLNPNSAEQEFHNATQIVECWMKLKLSFTITPLEIVNSNAIKMLMLTAYLFEVLPYYYVTQSFNIVADLSSSTVETFEIENTNDYPISYDIVILNNSGGLVTVPNPTIAIAPKQKANLLVTFYAKFAVYEEVYLILSGEVPKYKYAKAMAFSLVIESNVAFASSTLTVPVQLYKVIDVEVPIQSPYQELAVYDIFYVSFQNLPESSESLLSVNINNCQSISSLADGSVIPKRMMIFQNNLECDEAGTGMLSLTFAMLTNISKTYWIIFRDASVGDFMIKIINECDISEPMYINVDVDIPRDFEITRCTCKLNGDRCGRNLRILIPCFNIYLYYTFLTIMLRLSSEEDSGFWRRTLNSGAGRMLLWSLLKIIQCHFNDDVTSVLESTRTYNITSSLNLPTSTTIPNVTHHMKHTILYHIPSNETPPDSGEATLMSTDELEIRHYKFTFVEDPLKIKETRVDDEGEEEEEELDELIL